MPAALRWLFWDTDADRLDVASHLDYVLERVMSRGDLAAMRWLLAATTREQRAAFLRRRGDRLPPRERAFWCLVSGEVDECRPGGGRPAWAG